MSKSLVFSFSFLTLTTHTHHTHAHACTHTFVHRACCPPPQLPSNWQKPQPVVGCPFIFISYSYTTCILWPSSYSSNGGPFCNLHEPQDSRICLFDIFRSCCDTTCTGSHRPHSQRRHLRGWHCKHTCRIRTGAQVSLDCRCNACQRWLQATYAHSHHCSHEIPAYMIPCLGLSTSMSVRRLKKLRTLRKFPLVECYPFTLLHKLSAGKLFSSFFFLYLQHWWPPAPPALQDQPTRAIP